MEESPRIDGVPKLIWVAFAAHRRHRCGDGNPHYYDVARQRGISESAGNAGSRSRSRRQENLKQTVLIENRPASGSMIASNHVAKAQPDGYTAMFGC
jgi:Tripartite tricarboxylate transporter family receptor